MNRKKILLVDDVRLFLEQERSFLNREDFEVLCARSGAEAIEVALESRPDLIMIVGHGDPVHRPLPGGADRHQELHQGGRPAPLVVSGVAEALAVQ